MKKLLLGCLILAIGYGLPYGIGAIRSHQSAIRNPQSAIAPPTPGFAPDPEVLAFANAVLAQRPWTQVNGQWVTGLPVPDQTSFAFLYEPHIEKQEIDGHPAWVVTFAP